MKQGTVSIIVPVYNVSAYLDRCVQSLRQQSYQEMEIILVNDGSTDQSGSLCDDYAGEDQRIRVIHKANGGLMSAWKAGVAASSGQYLCFVDSDDWIELCMIADMAAHLNLTAGEMVCCNHIIDRISGGTREKHGLEPGVYEGKRLQELFHEILGNEHRKVSMSRCMKLISRELIEDNLHFCNEKLKMGEDVNIILPALLDSKRLVIMADAYYYHYFYNDTSMVHAYDQGLYGNIRLLREIILTVFKQKAEQNKLGISEDEIEAQCGREYLFLLMLVLKNEARGNRQGKTYRDNIKEVCRTEDTPGLLKQYPIQVREKANRLLYLVLRYPGGLTIRLLRMAMKVFYGGR